MNIHNSSAHHCQELGTKPRAASRGGPSPTAEGRKEPAVPGQISEALCRAQGTGRGVRLRGQGPVEATAADRGPWVPGVGGELAAKGQKGSLEADGKSP